MSIVSPVNVCIVDSHVQQVDTIAGMLLVK
jgi:hypothetical protein